MTDKAEEILRNQWILKFPTYEDYLESFITPRDLYHLRSKLISRQIIELGYHTKGTFDRETFYKRIKLTERWLYLKINPFDLCSKNIEITDVFLQELALREQPSRRGEIFTIIFMNQVGQSLSQVTGFIDYTQRLKTEDWKPYFEGESLLSPKKTDLSYFDWKTGKSILNESPNFKPMVDGTNGLVFQCVHDSALVVIDTSYNKKTNPRRVSLFSEIYGHVVLYDYLGDICNCE